ncbi:HD domain-containing protein [Dyella sp.]|uniref:HD domain-containing protein n=1 Tax=Dyella sp. TaxID=1869338 RepID=UPI003216AE60
MNSRGLPDYHLFRFSRADVSQCFSEESFREVIATDAFRRLETIHFLGAIDYLMYGGAKGVEQRHTRYDHSLAVANLARRFALAKNVGDKEYETIVIAGLLHDIGHAPLSHSLEPAFRSIFEIDHHLVGERILRGDVPLGIRLARALQRNDINNFEVMTLIAGVGRGIGREIFSRAINVDTIEGIIRSASYLHRKEVVLNPISVLDALVDLGKGAHEILDQFWMLKNHVYKNIIQARVGLVADYMCKRYMELNSESFRSTYYYGKEAELRRDHQGLFQALDAFGRENIIVPNILRDGEEIRYTRREFYIDESIVLHGYADLDRRYLQRKEVVTKEIRKVGGDDNHVMRKYSESRELF